MPDVNAENFRQHLREAGTDLLISVSCPQIFKKPLIELPQLGCLNIHGAILPHYRESSMLLDARKSRENAGV
ncbi:MAG: hypothetical protein IPJ46_09430 [Anaerolineales bacterium]|nr:hypothetical protein [Anaerolineales bacterium]